MSCQPLWFDTGRSSLSSQRRFSKKEPAWFSWCLVPGLVPTHLWTWLLPHVALPERRHAWWLRVRALRGSFWGTRVPTRSRLLNQGLISWNLSFSFCKMGIVIVPPQRTGGGFTGLILRRPPSNLGLRGPWEAFRASYRCVADGEVCITWEPTALLAGSPRARGLSSPRAPS